MRCVHPIQYLASRIHQTDSSPRTMNRNISGFGVCKMLKYIQHDVILIIHYKEVQCVK